MSYCDTRKNIATNVGTLRTHLRVLADPLASTYRELNREVIAKLCDPNSYVHR